MWPRENTGPFSCATVLPGNTPTYAWALSNNRDALHQAMTNQRSVNVCLDSCSTYRFRCCANALVKLCVSTRCDTGYLENYVRPCFRHSYFILRNFTKLLPNLTYPNITHTSENASFRAFSPVYRNILGWPFHEVYVNRWKTNLVVRTLRGNEHSSVC